MKILYLWISLLVVLGLALSLYLIPSSKDLALIQLRGNRYSQATPYYKEQYLKGIRTPDVMIPLVKIYEHEGNLSEAIAILKECLQDYPNDVKALRMLADLYLFNLQYEQYFQTLKKLKTDPESLQDLALWYEIEDENKPLFSILQELIHTKNVTSDNYLGLANLYIEKKEYKQASSLLEERRSLFPKSITISDIFLEMWADFKLSKDQGGNKELEIKAVDLLSDYLVQLKDKKTSEYAFIVFKERYPSYILYFIDQIHPLLQDDPYLELLMLETLKEQSIEPKQVFARLIQLYAKNSKDPQIQQVLFKEFLEQNDDLLLADLILKIEPGRIEDQNIIALCIQTIKDDKPFLAIEMQKALGPSYLKDHPMIATSLALGAQEEGSQEALNLLMKTRELTPSDLFDLFKVTSEAGLQEEALTLGSQLFPFIGFHDYEFVDMARAYIHMNQAEKLYLMIQKTEDPNGKASLALLDIALGRSKQAANWLSSQKEITEPILSSLYTVAEEEKNYPIALYVAKRYKTDYPSSLSQANYGLALIQVGKVKPGMTLLKQLYISNPQDETLERIYFGGLVFSAKKDPFYTSEMKAFMQEKESEGFNSPDLMRDFAYAYLEVLHDPSKAEKIFFKLAKEASPRSSEVQTLVYVWGPRPSQTSVLWLEEQAIHSKSEDLGYWLQYLVFTGNYETVINLFLARSNEQLKPNAYFAYMDALSYEDKKEPLKKAVALSFKHMKDSKQLEKLASYAETAGDLEEGEKIWERLAKENPKSPLIWQRYGKAAFDLHDYDKASSALQTFFTLCNQGCKTNLKLYESLYEYGETFYKNREFHKAQDFYLQSLAHIEKEKQQSFEMIQIKVLILYRLGRTKEAEMLMSDLYERSGKNSNVGASYVNLLMDSGHIRSARKFLDEALKCTHEH